MAPQLWGSCLRLFFNSPSKEAYQLAVDPDLDGGAVQDLSVTVPGASGGQATAPGAVVADLPESLLPGFLQVTVLIFHVL